ncbi:hypothetical protein PYCC9005_004783 [Savitreella phatthalungensis]
MGGRRSKASGHQGAGINEGSSAKLLAWAGVRRPLPPAHDTAQTASEGQALRRIGNSGPHGAALVFKIDKDKLQACQRTRSCSTGDHGGDGPVRELSRGSDDATLSDCSVGEAVCTTAVPPKQLHPFFAPKNKVQPAGPQPPKNKAPVDPASVHAFFKPRAKADTQHQQPGIDSHEPRTITLGKGPLTPWPSRHEMHVYDGDSPARSDRAAKRRRVEVLPADARSSATVGCVLERSGGPGPEDAKAKAHSHVHVQTLEEAQMYMYYPGHPAIRRLLDASGSAGGLEDLWTTAYEPSDVTGLLDSTGRPRIFRDWLASRKLRRDAARFDASLIRSLAARAAAGDELDDFIVDDDEEDIPASSQADNDDSESCVAAPAGWENLWQSNLAVLCGGHGVGKSACVRVTARELGYDVFEVNGSSRRAGKDIVEAVGEAIDSRMVNRQGSSKRSLILFEECDLVYRDDKDFWPTVLTLAARSRRPVVLTCNNDDVLPQVVAAHGVVIDMHPPPQELLEDYVRAILARQNRPVSTDLVRKLCRKRDIRSALTQAQLGDVDGVGVGQDEAGEPSLTLAERARDGFYSSLADVWQACQRSLFLDTEPAFEREDDEGAVARIPQRDDLQGHPIISEPAGRFTPLAPGDMDLCRALWEARPRSSTVWPGLRVPDWPTDDGMVRAVGGRLVGAVEIVGLPADWAHESFVCRSVVKTLSVGDLASQVVPRLRTIARLDAIYAERKHAFMQGYTGRLTRNTLSAADLASMSRPPYFDDPLLIRAIIDTAPARWAKYDAMAFVHEHTPAPQPLMSIPMHRDRSLGGYSVATVSDETSSHPIASQGSLPQV